MGVMGVQSLDVIAALPYAAAIYTADRTLRQANDLFWQAMAPVTPGDVHEVCASLDELASHLGLDLSQVPANPQVFGARAVVQLSLAAFPGGGWVLTAMDVTQHAIAERKAERSQKIALIALADLAENRDTDTGEHILRVARLTHEITRWLYENGHYRDQLTEEFRRNVGLASILHDVGKVAIPDSILLKAGPLTAEERAEMEHHAVRGAAILRKATTMLAGSAQFELAMEIAEHHHERWDGAGYPHRLKGEAIPLSARIVAAADVFDALNSERPYKKPWPLEKVMALFAEEAGHHFDPRVVEALAQVVDRRADAHTIPWTAAMSVGHAMVDHDHRILLALVNQVASPGTREDPIAIEFILDELLGYTASHFAREEALMDHIDYPELAEHRAVHQAMLEEVRQLHSRLISFTPSLSDDLAAFLGDWLTRHILIEDHRYRPYLTNGAA